METAVFREAIGNHLSPDNGWCLRGPPLVFLPLGLGVSSQGIIFIYVEKSNNRIVDEYVPRKLSWWYTIGHHHKPNTRHSEANTTTEDIIVLENARAETDLRSSARLELPDPSPRCSRLFLAGSILRLSKL